MKSTTSRIVLPTIVLAQFLCTSMWFAGNAVVNDLISNFGFSSESVGYLLSSVQLGFISGTFAFAYFRIADRFQPSYVFLTSALLGALFNYLITLSSGSLSLILMGRFLSGFFLAGIYPVGMKIAADHFDKGLGKSLGYLVGALVFGTALPHLIRSFDQLLEWKSVFYATSILSLLGGLGMALLVPEGPYRKANNGFKQIPLRSLFRNKEFKAASNGYFGHMWELYTFWAFVPVMLLLFEKSGESLPISISLGSFFIIAFGSLACVVSTQIAYSVGAQKIATLMLGLSGLCCILFPFILSFAPFWVFYFFLLFWGFVVIADSPLFSTLVAQSAEPSIKGTALTIVNGIGFGITIISIEILNLLFSQFSDAAVFIVLGLGPLYGLYQLNSNASRYAHLR